MSVLKGVLVGSFFLLVLGIASPARADAVSGTLSLTDCGGGKSGCPAATYMFTLTNNSATLTIGITGPVNSTNDEITGVDLGTNGLTLSGLGVTGPSGSGSWLASATSLSNSGCGNNNGSFMCAQGLVTIQQGSSYQWTWGFDSLTNSEIDSLIGSGIHIGANYGPHNGLIVSQTTPEPTSLLLLGMGLLAMGGMAIRRRIGT